MAYSKTLVKRIRSALQLYPEPIRTNIFEKSMFGGVAFLYKGKMTIGVVREDLMVRVRSEFMTEALCTPEVKPMDFTGRPMKEFVFVGPGGYASEMQLGQWLEKGLAHARHKLKEE